MKNKSSVKIITLIASLFIIFMMCFLISNGLSKKDKLNKKLNILGDRFYANYYSKLTTSKNIDMLSQYKDIGITVSLYNLKKYTANNESIIKLFKNNRCDDYKTKITIYPTSPYDKKDYKIKTELSCEKIK